MADEEDRPLMLAKHGHLGGYIYGGDPWTYCPTLWQFLIDDLAVKSVLDVGCGDGQAVKFFRDQRGVQAIGIDGVEQEPEWIFTHDFTTGPIGTAALDYDLVWSCEFVEHVEERYLPNFVETFKRGKLVLMTHAFPGQGGWHHVNCREADYWVGVMAGAGYAFDPALTEVARELAAKEPPGESNHFARSGLAFVRNEP